MNQRDGKEEMRLRIVDLENSLALMRAHRDALLIQCDRLRDEVDALRRARIETELYKGEG